MALSIEGSKVWFRKQTGLLAGKPSESYVKNGIIHPVDIKEEDIPLYCETLQKLASQLVQRHHRKLNGLFQFVTPPCGWGIVTRPPEDICIETPDDPSNIRRIKVYPLEQLKQTSKIPAWTPALVLEKDAENDKVTGKITRHYYRGREDENPISKDIKSDDIAHWYRILRQTNNYVSAR